MQYGNNLPVLKIQINLGWANCKNASQENQRNKSDTKANQIGKSDINN